MKKEGTLIKKGRTNQQFIHTGFEFIDSLNEFAGCETLGFYVGLKSYINRSSESNKENQVTYTQSFLESKLGIGKSRYYKHLKSLFSIGLIDIEKSVLISFFVNYNEDGKINPRFEKEILYFSTLENININLKDNLESLIVEHYPNIPENLLKIVNVEPRNSYIVHDNPPIDILNENHYKYVPYREWDLIMNKFKRGKNKLNNNESIDLISDFISIGTPPSQNEKEGASQNEKEPPSQNEKVNNIIELNNNIIKPINLSKEILKKERLTELNENIKEQGFKSYEDLIYEINLNHNFFQYPYTEWVEATKKAIWQMYYHDYTKIEGKEIPRNSIIKKLQDLNYDITFSTLRKVVESSSEQVINHPVAFIKTVLFNEIHEFSAAINAQVNYNLKL